MDEYRRSLGIDGSDASTDVDDEIDFHLEMKERDLLQQGVAPEDAHEQALAAFGDGSGIRRECADVQRVVRRRRRWGSHYDAWMGDLRLALRGLRRAPRFAVALALALGLGIGAASTVFSMLDAVLLAPLPYPEQDRLHLLFELREGFGQDRFDLAGHEYLRDAQDVFDRTAVFTAEGGTLAGEGPPERVGLLEASADFLPLLGAVPAYGRLLTPSDEPPGAPRVAVMSHELWQRRFGGDPGVVGATIQVNGSPVRVVGILSDSFDAAGVRPWAGASDLVTNFNPESREWGIFTVLARRADSATPERIREDLDRIAADLSRLRPFPFQIEVTSLAGEVTGAARPAVIIVFGAALILLLITCANAATLILSRGPERERELAVLSALGAGRDRLARRAAIECVVIAMVGASLSILVVLAAQSALRGLAPEMGWFADRSFAEGWRTIPWLSSLDVNVAVLAFTASVAVLASLLFALLPARRAARSDPSELLRRRTGSPLSRLGRLDAPEVLAITQVALAFVLLVGGGLLVRSFLAFRAIDLGFTSKNVLSLYVNPSEADYPSRVTRVGFYDEVLRELRALPGVELVGAVDGLPLSGGVGWTRAAATAVSGERWRAEAMRTLPRHVSPGYFEAMGIQVVAGRAFDDSDARFTQRVLVVDQALARRLWPGEDPIGKPVYGENGFVWGTVAGMVANVRYEPVGIDQPGVIYDVLPQRGDGTHGLYFVLRTGPGAPPDLLARARQVAQQVDPDQPVIDARTMEARLDDALVVRRVSATLLEGFALLALTLALVGLYGTVVHSVSRSLHAIAVRMALGAPAHRVATLVLRRTLLLTTVGTVLGAVIALGLSSAARSLLYGVSPADPATFVGVGAAFLVVSVAAAVGPARRAVTVYPIQHLKAT